MGTEQEASSDKIWLIRSSTRILGPFNFDEIKELLITGQISIIDEVRSTQNRWSYIRENKDFLEIVKNVREQMDRVSENTMTQSVAQHTMTKTDTININSDELTPTPTPTPPFSRRESDSRNTLKDVTSTAEYELPRQTAGTVRSYGTMSDSRLQNQISKKNKLVRMGVLAAVVLALVVAVLQSMRQEKQRDVGYDELLNQALRYRSLGLYEKSLNYYKKVLAIKEPDFESQVEMAPVLISEDRQTLSGRRILEKALTTPGRSRNALMTAYVGVGLSYLMDGDLKEASDTLQKALGYEPASFDARMNMAIVQMRNGDYTGAYKDFSSLSHRTPQSSLALLGKVIAILEKSKSNVDTGALMESIRDIHEMEGKTGYLRNELTLLSIYANTILGNRNESQNGIMHFLNELPGESNRYVKNLLIDWRMTQWDYLERFCSDVYSRQPVGPQTRAMKARCLMEVHRESEAQKFLEEALAESPRDPYVLATQATYLKAVGRIPEALSILKMPELSSLSIKNYLMGSICIATQDLPCVHRAYSELYKNDKDAPTLYGLAWLANQNQDRTRAYEYVQAGLQLEPNYIPLLELRDELESD